MPYWHGKELFSLSCERNYGWDEETGSFRWYRNFVTLEGAGHNGIAQALGIDKYQNKVAEFAETFCGAKSKIPIESSAAERKELDKYWDSLWSWRRAVNPLLAGMAFGGLVIVAMIFIRRRQLRRAEQRHRDECRKIAERLEGKRLESQPVAPVKIDKPIHLDSKTMPLGLKKLVKTGASYDKCDMG